jgi:hypothetical protein
LRVKVSVDWWITEGQDVRDLEDLEWAVVLRLLRRAGKRNFNMYGEERAEEESEEFDRAQAQLFYIGDRARVRGEY